MDTNNNTPAASSVTTASDVSFHRRRPGYHILEITLISAQDLAPGSKSLRTYALIWIHPNRKRTTSIDQHGHTNPTWNNKFSFKVDDEFLVSEQSAVTVEIYTVSWFGDGLIGTVSLNVSNLFSPSVRGKRFVALQIRRPSGSPQGILNMGVALLDNTSRSMPLNDLKSTSSDYQKDLDPDRSNVLECDNVEDEEKQRINEKIQLWRRSMSVDMSDLNCEEFPEKQGSVCNGGSVLNYGSEVYSDVGPSASIVAAEIAKNWQPSTAPRKETMERGVGDSMVLADMTPEEAAEKGLTTSMEGWRRAAATAENEGIEMMISKSGHGRRNSGSGVYSCFVYGFQFTIVCGASNNNNGSRHSNNTNKGKKKSITEINSD